MPMSTEEIINTITISVIVGIGYLYLTYAHPWVSSRTGEIISIIIGVAVCGSLIAVYYFVGLPILRTLFGVQRDPEEVTPDKLPNPSEGGSAMMRGSSSFMRVAATGGAIIFLAKLAFKPKKVASAAPKDDVATNTLL